MVRGKALNRKLTLFFGILSVLLWCNTTYATILKPLNMAKLVEKSSLIVEGQVTDIRSAWNENQTMILTEIDITLAQANAVLKGETANNTVTLKLWGGTVSDPDNNCSRQSIILNERKRLIVSSSWTPWRLQRVFSVGRYGARKIPSGKWCCQTRSAKHCFRGSK